MGQVVYFVGGPWNGKKDFILPDNRDIVLVAKPAPLPRVDSFMEPLTASIEKGVYRRSGRRKVGYSPGVVSVFVWEGWQ